MNFKITAVTFLTRQFSHQVGGIYQLIKLLDFHIFSYTLLVYSFIHIFLFHDPFIHIRLVGFLLLFFTCYLVGHMKMIDPHINAAPRGTTMRSVLYRPFWFGATTKRFGLVPRDWALRALWVCAAMQPSPHGMVITQVSSPRCHHLGVITEMTSPR